MGCFSCHGDDTLRLCGEALKEQSESITYKGPAKDFLKDGDLNLLCFLSKGLERFMGCFPQKVFISACFATHTDTHTSQISSEEEGS